MAALLAYRPELIFLSIFSIFSVAFSDELQTLLSIKSSLTNPTTKTNVFKNWEPNTPLCNFTGIKCNSNGSVKEIELSSQSLSGFVPFDKICSLNSLEKLSLGFNSLSGRVTNELNNCVSLNYLDVGNNDFTGSFPDISSLSKLTHFYANNSGFSGEYPWNSVANMSKLIVLSLGDNQFDRTPFPEVIVKLDQLNWLYLSNCGLEGEIPEGIGNLTEVVNLELSMNHLTGEIPSGITKLTKLWQLELYENELTGKLPVGFGNLTSLEYFDASTNYLYGDLSEIRELNNLVSLQLLQNEFSGEVPVELGEFKKLVNVSLYTNKLTGQLPQKLGSWANFDFIDISENNFTGPIPPAIAIKRVQELAGQFGPNLSFYNIDLRDKPAVEKLFESHKFDAVIHFAGLKAVGESCQKPLMYYNNNITGTITLLEVMATRGCKNLVFSSSSTVYGWPKEVPCTEESPISAANPYGRTKLFTEEICRDVYHSDHEWKVILLRYFNPIGAHPSGYIGDDPRGIPNNLMPFVQQIAVGRRPALTVYGTDYPTKDGTAVRDYIHVVDLADGHIAALQKLFDPSTGCEVYNLGTGKGSSVLEVVSAFEKASGKKIPLVMSGRRPGDAEIVYAATEKAERELNWRAKYGIDEMCRDQWNWASKNPYGYEGSEESN